MVIIRIETEVIELRKPGVADVSVFGLSLIRITAVIYYNGSAPLHDPVPVGHLVLSAHTTSFTITNLIAGDFVVSLGRIYGLSKLSSSYSGNLSAGIKKIKLCKNNTKE